MALDVVADADKQMNGLRQDDSRVASGALTPALVLSLPFFPSVANDSRRLRSSVE